MNPTSSDTAPLYASKAAMGLMGALLVGFLVILSAALIDRSHRSALETTSESTAVGDHAFAPAPQPGSKAPLGKANGLLIIPASPLEKIEIRDVKMNRVGREESGAFALYQTKEKLENGVNEKGDANFVKLGPDSYLQVKLESSK